MHEQQLTNLFPIIKSVFGRRKAAIVSFMIASILIASAVAQMPEKTNLPTQFRVGEKITYTVSFDKFTDVAYAEINTVSRGLLSGKDAIEIRSKIKTLNFFSAAFYAIDEERSAFVAPDSGVPLYVSKTENLGGLPRETIDDYLKVPTINLDLLSLICKIRQSGGIGAATLVENSKTYGVSFQAAGFEKIRTTFGEFDTTIVSVQSDYLTEIGVKDLKINLSTDEARIPVVVRVKTAKGEFRALAASVQLTEPEPEIAPTPVTISTPRPSPTPTPARTPQPYIENRPLAPELSFVLGETLEYRVTNSGRPIGTFVLRARERKEIDRIDSLVLTATATNAEAGNPVFNLNDSITVYANPETLAPRRIEIKLSAALSSLNQTAIFDDSSGSIVYKGNSRIDAPVGTHSILSLIYAMRSFNLKPSKILNNPVNDTRVAVFWESQPYIFTLRPSSADFITLRNEKVSAQLISITTGNPKLDQLAIKIWLSNDERRVPLRFTIGGYQADLESVTNIPLR